MNIQPTISLKKKEEPLLPVAAKAKVSLSKKTFLLLITLQCLTYGRIADGVSDLLDFNFYF